MKTNAQKIEWVAENVMGWTKVATYSELEASGPSVYLVTDSGQINKSEGNGSSGYWNPLKQPKATLELLEAVARQGVITIEIGQNQSNQEQAMVSRLAQNERRELSEDHCKCAPTLPQALLDFAVLLTGGEL